MGTPQTTAASTKPGWQTSEFWMTLLVKLITIVMAFKGSIPAALAVLILAILTSIYTIMRSVIKFLKPDAVIPELPPGTPTTA